jgi:hypothetical protein
MRDKSLSDRPSPCRPSRVYEGLLLQPPVQPENLPLTFVWGTISQT